MRSTGQVLVVTDPRVSDREHGIYDITSVPPTMILPGVSGSSICALSNGGALVARYGQEVGGPFKGVPGSLLYIPPSLLS